MIPHCQNIITPECEFTQMYERCVDLTGLHDKDEGKEDILLPCSEGNSWG